MLFQALADLIMVGIGMLGWIIEMNDWKTDLSRLMSIVSNLKRIIMTAKEARAGVLTPAFV
jgi:hypothetical protein